jgi:hypothetical protein
MEEGAARAERAAMSFGLSMLYLFLGEGWHKKHVRESARERERR